MESFPQLIGAGGVFGALAIVLIVLIRQNAADRRDYRIDVAAREKVWDLERRNLTQALATLQAELDLEREKRRKTEDDRDRDISRLNEKIRNLEDQVHILTMRVENRS